MRLTVAIPEAQMDDAPAVLRLMRAASACEVEAVEQGSAYVACFDDFPQSVDAVARLIEGTWDLEDICITVDRRPVVSPVKFYNALLCYRESMGVPDAVAYCALQASSVGGAGECPDRACLSHCRFICSRCLGLAHEQGAPPLPVQPQEIARQAEVDWCPNLRIARSDA